MGGGHTSGELVGAVSEAGGLGVIGASFVPPDEVAAVVAQARAITAKPIGINLLLHATEERIEEILEHEPTVFSTAWPRDDQDLATIFARAHDRGAKVMHMAPTLADAERAAESGAAVVVAQGTGLPRRLRPHPSHAIRRALARPRAGGPQTPRGALAADRARR